MNTPNKHKKKLFLDQSDYTRPGLEEKAIFSKKFSKVNCLVSRIEEEDVVPRMIRRKAFIWYKRGTGKTNWHWKVLLQEFHIDRKRDQSINNLS